MTGPNDEGDQDEEDYEIVSPEDVFFIDQDLREKNVQRVSFDRCETVRRVGRRYWRSESKPIVSTLSDDLNLSKDEVRWATSAYYLAYEIPADEFEAVSGGAYSVMIKYFRDLESISKIASDQENDRSTVQRQLREFLGGVLGHTPPEEIDLNEIDRLPPAPQTLSERVSQRRTTASANVGELRSQITNMHAATHALATSDAPSKVFDTHKVVSNAARTVQFMHSSEFQDRLRALRMPQDAAMNMKELTDALHRAVQYTSFEKIRQQIHEYITQAILDGITNFDGPADYDPATTEVSSFVKDHGISELDEICVTIDEGTDGELDAYLERTRTGLEAYRRGNHVTAIFLFISVQDGLMAALCEWEHGPRNNGYYHSGEKRNTLQEVSTGYYGVGEDLFVDTLERFYDHRNAIMHGDPVVHFDENIATITLLFLVMTYKSVFDYRD